MDLEIGGKVAIIGGASKGLGRACAQVLAEEGAKVVICSRTKADLDAAADEIRGSTGAEVLSYPGDLDNHETIINLIAATVERFGQLDIMINNSGGPPLARAATADENQWAVAVQRSLLFFARMSREALPHLRNQGGGRIINILASTVYQPIDNLALSGATRMGVVAWAKSLADEVGTGQHPGQQRLPRLNTQRPDALQRHVTRQRTGDTGGGRPSAASRRDRRGPCGRTVGVRLPGRLPGLVPLQLHHRHYDVGGRGIGQVRVVGVPVSRRTRPHRLRPEWGMEEGRWAHKLVSSGQWS